MLDLGNWASEKYRISEPIFDESEFEGADRGENHDDDNARGHNR